MWMKSGCLGQLFWSQPNESWYVESALRKIQSCYVNSAFGDRTDWGSKASACQDCETSIHEQSIFNTWGDHWNTWSTAEVGSSCMDRSWTKCAWAITALLHQPHVRSFSDQYIQTNRNKAKQHKRQCTRIARILVNQEKSNGNENGKKSTKIKLNLRRLSELCTHAPLMFWLLN